MKSIILTEKQAEQVKLALKYRMNNEVLDEALKVMEAAKPVVVKAYKYESLVDKVMQVSLWRPSIVVCKNVTLLYGETE